MAGFLDFDLVEVFNKTREGVISKRPFLLPFDDYQSRFNHDISLQRNEP